MQNRLRTEGPGFYTTTTIKNSVIIIKILIIILKIFIIIIKILITMIMIIIGRLSIAQLFKARFKLILCQRKFYLRFSYR